MRFVNDHDPLPLFEQLRGRYGEAIAIEYRQLDPGAIVIDLVGSKWRPLDAGCLAHEAAPAHVARAQARIVPRHEYFLRGRGIPWLGHPGR